MSAWLLVGALVGCAEEPPTCEYYVGDLESGYWREVRDERAAREAVLTVDALRALGESVDIRSAFINAACHVATETMNTGGDDYVIEPESTARGGPCLDLVGQIETYRADFAETAAGIEIETDTRCGLEVEGYLVDVGYCAEIDAPDPDALSCEGELVTCDDGTSRACTLCVGELRVEGLPSECASILTSRAQLLPRCTDASVSHPTGEPAWEFQYRAAYSLSYAEEGLLVDAAAVESVLEGLDTLEAGVDEGLRRSGFRGCREPAHATIERTRRALEAELDAARAVLEALGPA